MKRNLKQSIVKAFTLIELIVVIAIISVLGAILIPNMLAYIRQAQIATDITNAKEIYEATQLIMMLDPQAYNEVMADHQDNQAGFKPSQGGNSDLIGKDNRPRQTIAKLQGTRNPGGTGSGREGYWVWSLDTVHYTDTFCNDLNEAMHFTSDNKPNCHMKCNTHPTARTNTQNAKNSNRGVITDRWCIARVKGTDEIEIWACSSFGSGGGQYGIYRLWPNPDKEYYSEIS